MKLMDLDDGREYTLPALRSEWEALRREDPENHSAYFRTEMSNILIATVNGRNNLEIVGPTPAETDRIIMRLRRGLYAGV